MPMASITCWRCKKRIQIAFDAIFEHVEFQAHQAGFKFHRDPSGKWWTYCDECYPPLFGPFPPKENL